MKRLLLVSMFLFVAVAAYAQMSGSAEKTVADLEHQWNSAMKSANADALAPLLADNFVDLDTTGTLRNRAETMAEIKSNKFEISEIGDVKVTITGNTAIATGTWRGKGTSADGKPIDAKERWVDTWVKTSSGKWQCLASASSPVKM